MTHCRKIAVGGISSEKVLTPSVSVYKCVPKAHVSLGPRPQALVPKLLRYPSAFPRRAAAPIRELYSNKTKRESPTIGFRYPSAFPWGKGDRVAVDEGNPILQI